MIPSRQGRGNLAYCETVKREFQKFKTPSGAVNTERRFFLHCRPKEAGY